MLLHPTRCVERLSEDARSIHNTGEHFFQGSRPWGLPVREMVRSPAAARVARFAGEAGLGLFHYEHRVQLDLPEDWVPADHPELVETPDWSNGVLPERKYQSFRHDQAIGSFNPGHRAKWGTHELCHGLVGYAWWSGASTLEMATAARLAELVPVLLWYFLDEAFLTRCPLHAGGDALFRTFCPACERLASTCTEDPRAEERIREGLRFLDRELAAISKTRRLGRPVPSHWATIDLCSDGIAYAVAHRDRLDSEAFHRYSELHGGGNHSESLDALEARAIAVAQAIAGESDTLETFVTDWATQDLGWRLWTIWHECEAEARVAIEGLCQRLQAGEDIRAEYQELHERILLPAPEELFALGYAHRWGDGRSLRQVTEGLLEGAPVTVQILEDAERLDLIRGFIGNDDAARQPLVVRFAGALSGDCASVARYEAALLAAKSDPLRALGVWEAGPCTLAEGVQLLRVPFDVVDAATRIESGALAGVQKDGAVWISGDLKRTQTALLIGRSDKDELIIVDIPVAVADALEAGRTQGLPDGQAAMLADLGLLLPKRWPSG